MRNITLAAQSQLLAQTCRPVLLVSCAFVNETIYVWSGIGNLTWNGHTWTGVGTLGNVSPVAEASTLDAQGIVISLSGVPTQLLADAMSQVSSSGQAKVYLGFLDATGALVASPITAFVGMMDQPEINISAETATIGFSVENKLSDLQRARGGRYTDQDQRARFPTDGGFKYVTWLQDQFIDWKGK